MPPVILPAVHQVHEFIAIEVGTPPGNREVTLDSVSDLLASIRQNGQLVPGIVYPNPEGLTPWLAAAGNRRNFVCNVLGICFKAIALDKAPDESALIKLRLTEDMLRKAMKPFEVACDVQRFIDLKKCTQEDAAHEFGLSPASISKMLRPLRLLTGGVLAMLASGELCRTGGSEIARLAFDKQLAFAERAIKEGWKRDRIVREVQKLLGKRTRQAKPTKITTPGGLTLLVPEGFDYDGVLDELKNAMSRVRKGKKIDEADDAPVLLPAG